MPSEAMWSPRFQSYKDALVEAEAITVEDLAAAMAQIAPEIRERLAAGPKPYRYHCGVCVAFGRSFYGSGAVDMTDPAWRVFLYHEVPKARMERASQEHHGPLSNELYERTIQTYKAAGWMGEAEGANA